MSRWWRAYDEAVDDPKLQKLPAEVFRGWFNICCITSQSGGVLPPIADIAFKLRMSEAKAEKLLAELRAAGLIDDFDGQSAPHNWNGRQFKTDNADPTNAVRQKRYRDRHRNAQGTVTNGVTITQPETEQNRTDSRAKRSEHPDFAEWYANYPKHEARGSAEKAYQSARKSTDAAVLLDGAKKAKARYAGSDPQFVPLPATWLNQKRWLDEAPQKSTAMRAQELYREGII